MFGFKKNTTPKKKEKMVFAKDRKQVVIMVLVWAVFVGNTAYTIFKYTHEQSPVQNNMPTQQSTQNPTPAQ